MLQDQSRGDEVDVRVFAGEVDRYVRQCVVVNYVIGVFNIRFGILPVQQDMNPVGRRPLQLQRSVLCLDLVICTAVGKLCVNTPGMNCVYWQ